MSERNRFLSAAGVLTIILLLAGVIVMVVAFPPERPAPTPVPLDLIVEQGAMELPDHVAHQIGRGAIQSFDFTPDGAYFAVGTTRGVYLYATQGLELKWFAPMQGYGVDYLAFSGTGERLAVADRDVVAVLLTRTGRRLFTLPINTLVTDIAWSSDQTRLAVADVDLFSDDEVAYVTIWDIAAGETLSRWEYEVYTLAWSPDGALLAAQNRRAITIWDAESGEDFLYEFEPREYSVNQFAFSPDSRYLAAVTGEESGGDVVQGPGEFIVWDMQSGEVVFEKVSDGGAVQAVAWSPDGTQLVTGNEYSQAMIWDLESGEEVDSTLISSQFLNLTWSANGQTIFGGTAGTRVGTWNLSDGQADLQTLDEHRVYTYAVAWSPAGDLLAGADQDGNLIIWDTSTFEQIVTRSLPKIDLITGLQFSGDGHLIVVEGLEWFAPDADNRVTVLNIDTLDIVMSSNTEPFASTASPSLSPDGTQLAVIQDYEVLSILSLDGSQETTDLYRTSTYALSNVRWSPDGCCIAALEETDLLIWNTDTGDLMHEINNIAEYPRLLRWSPDSQTLAVSTQDREVLIFDVLSGDLLQHQFFFNNIHDIEWSPDGAYLAGDFANDTVSIWDLEAGSEYQGLTGHTLFIDDLSWSPDGTQIASVANDGTIMIWDIMPQE